MKTIGSENVRPLLSLTGCRFLAHFVMFWCVTDSALRQQSASTYSNAAHGKAPRQGSPRDRPAREDARLRPQDANDRRRCSRPPLPRALSRPGTSSPSCCDPYARRTLTYTYFRTTSQRPLSCSTGRSTTQTCRLNPGKSWCTRDPGLSLWRRRGAGGGPRGGPGRAATSPYFKTHPRLPLIHSFFSGLYW